jgi:hypothetical protein
MVIPLTTMGVFAATGGLASAASPPPVTFKGSISCSLTGTVTFSTPLTLKSQAAIKATFKGKNVDCTGVGHTSLTQDKETLKSSTENFSFTIPANKKGGCDGLATGVSPAITGAVVDWIGTSPITPTGLKFSAGTITTAGLITYGSGTSTGSFAGTAKVQLQSSELSQVGTTALLPYTEANALKLCDGKGIADITFVQPKPSKTYPKNDNEEIGVAF